MRLPIYVITYQCRKCGTSYVVEWDPNQPGHVEPATACPNCASPVRVYVGVEDIRRGKRQFGDMLAPARIRSG